MKNKIAFICLNPWEIFLSHRFFFHVKEYYDWFCKQVLLLKRQLYCEEKIEVYGDPLWNPQEFFWKEYDVLQAMYVQCSNLKPLEGMLENADLLVVGMTYNRETCDKIFMSAFPWKDKSVFLWDGRDGLDPAFLKQCQREYLLRDEQIVQTKSFCHLGRSFYL